MDFEQDTVSLPRRGDLPLLRAVDSKMYLNQQCVIKNVDCHRIACTVVGIKTAI